MQKNKEKVLIQSFHEGDISKILNHLYQTTLKKVRKHILKNSGTIDEANDIFQDAVVVFVQFLHAGKWDYSQEIDAFVFTVAKNLWINKVRKDKHLVRMPSDGQSLYEGMEEGNQLSTLVEREKSSSMRRVFEKLDERCRELLLLVVVEDLSMKEICQRMGYNNENVAKSMHYKCKQNLAKLVKNDPEVLQMLEN